MKDGVLPDRSVWSTRSLHTDVSLRLPACSGFPVPGAPPPFKRDCADIPVGAEFKAVCLCCRTIVAGLVCFSILKNLLSDTVLCIFAKILFRQPFLWEMWLWLHPPDHGPYHSAAGDGFHLSRGEKAGNQHFIVLFVIAGITVQIRYSCIHKPLILPMIPIFLQVLNALSSC